jgi:radical S-adenosyl methionine domain-containing protein 2
MSLQPTGGIMKDTHSQQEVVQADELVINWHLTEACNYSCKYCYASWSRERGTKEVARNPAATRALLASIRDFFDPDNVSNPLRETMRWRRVRLSIAGGEAMLYGDRVGRIMKMAEQLGFRLSLITNGSLLPDAGMEALASYLSILGISIDSVDAETNRRIGRKDRNGVISLDAMAEKIELARRANPALKIKINTVVNALNAHEDLGGLIERLRPDRWKVLRVLPVLDTSLVVSDLDFNGFLQRHQAFAAVMSPEDNRLMTESYIMIDPLGRFFQNMPPTAGSGSYRYSSPILEAGVENAFSSIRFSASKFASRYIPIASLATV